MPEPLAIKSELMKRRTLKTKKICPKNCLNKRNFQKKKKKIMRDSVFVERQKIIFIHFGTSKVPRLNVVWTGWKCERLVALPELFRRIMKCLTDLNRLTSFLSTKSAGPGTILHHVVNFFQTLSILHENIAIGIPIVVTVLRADCNCYRTIIGVLV